MSQDNKNNFKNMARAAMRNAALLGIFEPIKNVGRLGQSLTELPAALKQACARDSVKVGAELNISYDKRKRFVRSYRIKTIFCCLALIYSLSIVYTALFELLPILSSAIFFLLAYESSFRLSQLIEGIYHSHAWFVRHKIMRPMQIVKDIIMHEVSS